MKQVQQDNFPQFSHALPPIGGSAPHRKRSTHAKLLGWYTVSRAIEMLIRQLADQQNIERAGSANMSLLNSTF